MKSICIRLMFIVLNLSIIQKWKGNQNDCIFQHWKRWVLFIALTAFNASTYGKETALTHYDDVIMGEMTSQITSLTIVYSTVYSGADQRNHQSSTSLVFVWGIHRGPVNSPHKWPVTRKMFPLWRHHGLFCFGIIFHSQLVLTLRWQQGLQTLPHCCWWYPWWGQRIWNTAGAPFYSHGLISSWGSNHMPSKVWDEITYPLLNFNCATVVVWEWTRNVLPHILMDVITNPCWD